ncbi:MAG: Methionyl-tRNA formyltransferase [Microgenomates group bacterium GW2011_GWC1_39_7b]|uniref:Methionyl-tRNA formyltransferase n=3 Tax=Candidatus Woeseibacteriota TaxID=1752722 RepID=A0A0G0UY62_9BACT|nr:MAG: Methionyl-tRNA formyltransferase [Candidatus Woesebacteria bacterium GW2011_GWB1_39_10]KKR26686.1 MAG: Methionyl-tRNA formyltransferase [Microgenomates group bacterium GW2011_GWC1_39_7b]KKR74193.1 MAG: Methionyl-tRNA formyltransferase [Candidatus Woesebacteria bacterium GW2011_GWA2_40_7]KKR92476.1 MAG: Methionyl-tRNA formyltransferase [Candidatus Woesebacteria bacterium GW2011_GWA1_41_13b]
MKIVFFGTPDYVLPVLTTLHKKFVSGPGKSPIVAVVTQSPKPTGRKQYLTYSPVDKWAHERKVFTHYSAEELIDANLDTEVGILASYGQIISKEVIDLFPKGILVIHPSLLPAYRGASPIQAAITNGDTQTGVTIFKMDEKIDHGPIVSQFKENIHLNDTFETLRIRLFERSAEVLAELIEPYLKGKISLKTQDEGGATYTKIVKREDGFVDLKKDSPEKIERLSRAMYPWPGIWTYLPNEKRLKILKCHLEDGKLILDEVQLEGKNPVSWKQFTEAYPEP